MIAVWTVFKIVVQLMRKKQKTKEQGDKYVTEMFAYDQSQFM